MLTKDEIQGGLDEVNTAVKKEFAEAKSELKERAVSQGGRLLKVG